MILGCPGLPGGRRRYWRLGRGGRYWCPGFRGRYWCPGGVGRYWRPSSLTPSLLPYLRGTVLMPQPRKALLVPWQRGARAQARVTLRKSRLPVLTQPGSTRRLWYVLLFIAPCNLPHSSGFLCWAPHQCPPPLVSMTHPVLRWDGHPVLRRGGAPVCVFT